MAFFICESHAKGNTNTIMIHHHLVADKPETRVFAFPAENGNPVFVLAGGSWLGVLDESNDWIHVLSLAGEGWVRREDTTLLPPMKLHISYRPDQEPEYIYRA